MTFKKLALNLLAFMEHEPVSQTQASRRMSRFPRDLKRDAASFLVDSGFVEVRPMAPASKKGPAPKGLFITDKGRAYLERHRYYATWGGHTSIWGK